MQRYLNTRHFPHTDQGGEVIEWGYGQALRALRSAIENSGRSPEEYDPPRAEDRNSLDARGWR